MSGDTSRLETALGHRFREQALLRQALTHRSFGMPHNERLEFLGDSILNAVTAWLLFDAFPERSEGELSRLRASLVKKETLAEFAADLGLSEYLRLGDGEARSGGYQRPSILADTLEALFAAICLDADFETAKKSVARLIAPRIAAIDPETHGKDSKTRLQEWLQAQRLALPEYLIVSQHGEAHDQHFVIACRIPALDVTCQGEGGSRRAAEQVAATRALAQLPAVNKGKKP
ncbi:ribonuclease III [Chitinimonas sp. BJB300]|uniref:ribonuclease III n=1 Tax=Chitinimonas sp. BJB300 TaxID=1559339 RepID=UPI000C0DBA60|nr:ribonuclease III [Chitinimonas sp. BJB300]PHV11573.1 ribonuclease III [Chitinimonas sp. BJB300]TSJ88969.1 ribonuclease III [Chitinimonas sp. BJB300]